ARLALAITDGSWPTVDPGIAQHGIVEGLAAVEVSGGDRQVIDHLSDPDPVETRPCPRACRYADRPYRRRRARLGSRRGLPGDRRRRSSTPRVRPTAGRRAG